MTKNRLLLLVSGVCLILLGLWALIEPAQTLLLLVGLIGAGALISGVCYLLAYFFTNRPPSGDRGWMLVRGLIDIAVGALLLWNIGVAASILPWVVGLWAVFSGALYLAHAVAMKSSARSSWWLMLLSGLLSIVIGVLMIVNPWFGAFVISFQIGFFLLLFGVTSVMAASSSESLT